MSKKKIILTITNNWLALVVMIIISFCDTGHAKLPSRRIAIDSADTLSWFDYAYSAGATGGIVVVDEDGLSIPVGLGSSEFGSIYFSDDGRYIKRNVVRVKGAALITNLRLTNLKLGVGDTLFIATGNLKNNFKPIYNGFFQDSRDTFGTGLMLDDTIIIEVITDNKQSLQESFYRLDRIFFAPIHNNEDGDRIDHGYFPAVCAPQETQSYILSSG